MSDDALVKADTNQKPTDAAKSDPLDWGPLGPDHVLQQLVDLTNSTSMTFSISLNVGGFLVSGTLVSGKTFFEGVASEMANAYKNNAEASEAMRKYFSNFGEVYTHISEDEDPDGPLPMYIHLADAKFFHNAGAPFPGNKGVWWRGRISSVSGFFLGGLSAG